MNDGAQESRTSDAQGIRSSHDAQPARYWPGQEFGLYVLRRDPLVLQNQSLRDPDHRAPVLGKPVAMQDLVRRDIDVIIELWCEVQPPSALRPAPAQEALKHNHIGQVIGIWHQRLDKRILRQFGTIFRFRHVYLLPQRVVFQIWNPITLSRRISRPRSSPCSANNSQD